MKQLLSSLDLDGFIDSFASFFAREKELYLEGDRHVHIRFIKELSRHDFYPPKKISPLDESIQKLQKSGILPRLSLYEFSKLIGYFVYLKKFRFEGTLKEWLNSIEIPQKAIWFFERFKDGGEFDENLFSELLSINISIESVKKSLNRELSKYLYNEKLAPYLVDRQLHFYDGLELLLLRPGYANAMKGRIVSRTPAGFFYILPLSVENLRGELDDRLAKKEEIEYKICKELSALLSELLPFLRFLNKQFDRFDHYQARVLFAKSGDFEFIENVGGEKIKLKSFIHPALDKKSAKSFTLSLDKKALIITGVNAGGKTMLLKSILSASFLAKYMIPMQVNAHESQVPSFANIKAVLEDPQNVKNNISTFSGRIRNFAAILNSKPGLVGVDEIELGTDSDEAAALFKVIIEELIGRGFFVVATTHHKKLASMLASNKDVELAAAIYDEEKESPKYEFLFGIIGKSYAFETALKYGIPKNMIEKAKTAYGEDKEKLSDLIEKGYLLQDRLNLELKALDEQKEKLKLAKLRFEEEKEREQKAAQKLRFELEKSFKEAIEGAKEAAKQKEQKEIHRLLNTANEKYKTASSVQKETKEERFDVGEYAVYRGMLGQIESIGANILFVVDGKRIKVDKTLFFREAKKSDKPKAHPKKAPKLAVQKPQTAGIKLDLHGYRVEEGIEELDKFISDSLLAGFEEILVYHGIGSGKLAAAVREYLKKHPSVNYIEDAPISMGGFGATLIHL